MSTLPRPDQAEVTPTPASPPRPGTGGRVSPASRLLTVAAPARLGGVYVFIAMIVVFSVWRPQIFPTTATLWQVLNSNATSLLAALTLVVPLAAGVFDISIPYTMSLSGVISAYAIVQSGLPVTVGVVLGVASGVVVGLVNATIVVVGKVDSLIGTLASGFLIQAIVLWRTSSQTITGTKLTGQFQGLALKHAVGQLTLPVIYAVVVALVIWYVLEMTATGRRTYATGFNREAARLANVRTAKIQFTSLVVSSTLAGVTGVVIAGQLGAGSPTAGNSYLLPAFAGVFVGATQFRPGRFNAWGTVLAVLLLGTLTYGLGLAAVPLWGQQLATGLVLTGALILSGRERRAAGKDSLVARRKRGSGPAQPDATKPAHNDQNPTTDGANA